MLVGAMVGRLVPVIGRSYAPLSWNVSAAWDPALPPAFVRSAR
jgi:hypothetical protein